MRYILALHCRLRNCCAARLRGVLEIHRQIRLRPRNRIKRQKPASAIGKTPITAAPAAFIRWLEAATIRARLNPQDFGWRFGRAAVRPEPTRPIRANCCSCQTPAKTSLYCDAKSRRENAGDRSDQWPQRLRPPLQHAGHRTGDPAVRDRRADLLDLHHRPAFRGDYSVERRARRGALSDLSRGGRNIGRPADRRRHFDDDRRPRADHRARHLDGRRRHRPHQGGDGGH